MIPFISIADTPLRKETRHHYHRISRLYGYSLNDYPWFIVLEHVLDETLERYLYMI